MKATIALAGVMAVSPFAGNRASAQSLQDDNEGVKTENVVDKESVLKAYDVNSPIFKMFDLKAPYAERLAALDEAVEQNIATKDTLSNGRIIYDDIGGTLLAIVSDEKTDFRSWLDQPYKIKGWHNLELQDWEKEALKTSESELSIASFWDVYDTQTGRLTHRSVNFLKEEVGRMATYDQSYDDNGNIERVDIQHNDDNICYQEVHLSPESPNLSTEYTHSYKQLNVHNSNLISLYVTDGGEKDGRLTKFDEDEKVISISFDTNPKDTVRFDYNDNYMLTGVTYEKDGKNTHIELKDSEQSFAYELTAQNGYARLLKEDISNLTKDNINQRVVQTYLKSNDTPIEGSPFYETYQSAQKTVNAAFVKLQKTND